MIKKCEKFKKKSHPSGASDNRPRLAAKNDSKRDHCHARNGRYATASATIYIALLDVSPG
jgi:hypothetical protein